MANAEALTGQAPGAPAPGADDTVRRVAGHTVYENPFMRVNYDDVVFPDGGRGNYTRVTSGTGLGVVAVPCAVYRGIGYLGLVRQYRYPVDGFTLEFPRGGSDDLTLEEAGRELVEETGLEYLSGSRLGILHPDTGLLDTRIAVWRTSHRIEGLATKHREQETGARLHWYQYGEVTGLVRSGKITCGITLAAFAMLGSAGVPVAGY